LFHASDIEVIKIRLKTFKHEKKVILSQDVNAEKSFGINRDNIWNCSFLTRSCTDAFTGSTIQRAVNALKI